MVHYILDLEELYSEVEHYRYTVNTRQPDIFTCPLHVNLKLQACTRKRQARARAETTMRLSSTLYLTCVICTWYVRHSSML